MEREVGNCFLTESKYSANVKVPSHAHEHASFYLVLSGCIAEKNKELTRDCTASTLVFTPPGKRHVNSTYEVGGRCFMIDLKTQWLNGLDAPSLNIGEWATFDGGAPVWLAQRSFSEACHLDALSPMVIEGITLELLAEISRARARLDAKSPRWLEQAREMLHAQFAEKLTIGAIANAVKRHPIHLASQFRRSCGCTIGHYLRRLRIEAARRRMVESDTPLTQIAADCGFADQSHLTRVFKAHLGITPSEYRQNYRSPKQRQTALSDPSS